MASPRDMVERLRPLVEAHRDRRQAPVRFRPQTWRPWLEPHAAAGTRHRPTRYVAYVQAVHAWAGPLDVSAARLEWLLFDLNGKVRTP